MLKLKPSRPVCYCSSYQFPHRPGAGTCEVAVLKSEPVEAGAFSYVRYTLSQLCAECRQPSEPHTIDFGIGHTEFWGVHSFHTDVQTVSACCEADFIDNRRKQP